MRKVTLQREDAPIAPPIQRLTGRLFLHIDDSLTIRKLVQVILEREGATVLSFADGMAAWKAISAQQLPGQPDLLLLDVVLPTVNGYDLARSFRAHPAWRETPIVFLSRMDGLFHVLRAKLVKTQATISKPFTTHQLVETLIVVLHRPLQDRSSV